MPITRALILAGGRSSRFNGFDKTFAMLAGRPLIEHVVARVRPQVDVLAISSNVAPERFAYLDVPVIADVARDVSGPLAGIYSGLVTWPDDVLLTVAVDLPFLPHDLVSRLRVGCANHLCAYASDGKRHAAALLWASGVATRVADYIATGQRNLRSLLETQGQPVVFVPDATGDVTFNVNTREDLAVAEQRVSVLRRS